MSGELSTLKGPYCVIEIFTRWKLWLAAATHSFQWMKITHICLFATYFLFVPIKL